VTSFRAEAEAEGFVPYPPIAQLGVIGDRRTAAVIGADGTVHWLCLPNYDGTPIFGCLLDSRRGGYWRLGPANFGAGCQSYIADSNVLVTHWSTADGELELTDAMLFPGGTRRAGEEGRRRVLRRLRCRRGSARGTMELAPRYDFGAGPHISSLPGGVELGLAEHDLRLWTSHPVGLHEHRVCANFRLAAGEEFWAVLGLEDDPAAWDVGTAREALEATIRYWQGVASRYSYQGARRAGITRSALAIELLSFAPTGAIVAAATSSLPERIGGDRNYDYRYAWVRDASMAVATLAVLGDLDSAERYLSWLARLGSTTEMPLQVLYRVDGTTDVEEHARAELAGYRGSRPVRFGNRAYCQRQIDSLGYLADCALIYLDRGRALVSGIRGTDPSDRGLHGRTLAPAEQRHLGTRSRTAFCQQQSHELDHPRARPSHRRPDRRKRQYSTMAASAEGDPGRDHGAGLERLSAILSPALRCRHPRRFDFANSSNGFSPSRASLRRRNRATD
jgi:GH15 family glucan-1,4-alpha-glucosidase